jgi:hypothetical protein
MKDPKRQAVNDHYSKASDFALEYVEQEARKILVKHPDLKEFIMTMGAVFFITWDDEIVYEELDYIAESDLAEFISDWDDYLKLTGEPMRFTATGPLVRDW